MKIYLNSYFIIIVMSFFVSFSHAQLIVVEDKGGISTKSYYDEFALSPEITSQQSEVAKPNRALNDADMLPVISLRLSPGAVAMRQIQATGLMPFFMIGDDELSKNWLIQRKEVLLQLNATGLIVNIQSKSSLEKLRLLAPALTLLPVSGDDIAQRLQLEHYPVLITSSFIEQ